MHGAVSTPVMRRGGPRASGMEQNGNPAVTSITLVMPMAHTNQA